MKKVYKAAKVTNVPECDNVKCATLGIIGNKATGDILGDNDNLLVGETKPIICKEAGGTLRLVGEASTDDIDRTLDIITPEAYAPFLERYKKNPLVTFQHNIYYPIGINKKIKITDNGLWVLDEILDIPNDPLLTYVRAAIQQRALRFFSVSFFPLEWHEVKNENGDKITVYTKVELIEHAVVSLPANPFAGFDIPSKLYTTDGVSRLTKLSFATAMEASVVDNLPKTSKPELTRSLEYIDKAGDGLRKLLGKSNLSDQYHLDSHGKLSYKAVISNMAKAKGACMLTDKLKRHLEKHCKELCITPPWLEKNKVAAWERVFVLVSTWAHEPEVAAKLLSYLKSRHS